ncbi:MAG: RNA polymerase subunit sigma [Dysgonamonadaceae bacterium]|nr:RNA polymerase subunit sigma [Dysgonamonadaceae bacterium]
MAEKIDFENMVGSELLEYISFKDEFPNEAELAFYVFCDRYQRDILQKAEIQCSKFGYNEAIAFLAAKCTFDKVWRSHTFDMKKANTKNVDRAILLWMYKILYTQILLFKDSDTCAQPTEEEDLSLIENLEELVNVYVPENLEKQKELKENYSFLERALQGLSQKHKIIYFTYLAYKPEKGKNIPRSVSKKLQEQLDLTQPSIRVYRKEATDLVTNYIDKVNGNK